MRVRSLLLAAAAVLAAVPSIGVEALPLTATTPAPTPTLLAGAAKVDSTWHVGASAGQYASDGFPVDTHGVDTSHHSTRRLPSYGIQSRESVRALVVQGTNGKRFALVSNDLYIPQDLVNRRVATLLEEHDRLVALGLRSGPATGIDDTNLTVSVSHSHSSPYYSTPSWGVWAFQDVFDIRFFEHAARKMADAVVAAARDLRPARVGGATSTFDKIQRHSFGPVVADDGTPAGYPETDNDKTVAVVAFDDVSRPDAPEPLATWVTFGLHPEMLDGNDLLTGEYVNAMETIVDREVGGVTLFSQNNTGTAEPARDARAHAAADRAEYSHREYAQMERAARLLADAVEGTRDDIATGTPEDSTQWAPYTTSAPVEISDLRFAPPSLRTLPTVSSCRAHKAFDGNPGVPLAGLPDCQFPLEDAGVAEQLPFDPGVTYDTLREAGVPVPDNVGAPSYTGLQETVQVHLQAIRIGDIAVTVCPCEQWADQSRNIKSRINRVDGDFWDGFDWTEQTTVRGGQPRPWCVQNADTTWTCANPTNPAADLAPVSDERYRRMRAQIHNDAKGWDDPAYAPYAETEPVAIDAIKGNYTHEELTPFGYGMVVPISMSNDYWGYIATYREFQRGDHYRKALTGLGPHSSDFLATRLTRMAASLNGGPAVALTAKDLAYAPESAHQRERARAIGASASALLPLYEATLPADGGVAGIRSQPADITRFQAAHVAWTGGSNWFDLPRVVVERLDGASWVPHADQAGLGGVQVKLTYPQVPDLPAWRAGQHAWAWEATFEAFDSDIALPDASGAPRAQTPAGTYRFVIDGVRHAGRGVRASYRLASDPFAVSPWEGITVDDVRVEDDGTVSFAVGPVNHYTYGTGVDYTVGPIDYPDTYASPFRFIEGRNKRDNLKTYGPGLADDEQFCLECSFRPWADTGTVASARVTVVGPGGSRVVGAVADGGRWRTTEALAPGESAFVARGGVVDGFGEFNGAPSATVTR